MQIQSDTSIMAAMKKAYVKITQDKLFFYENVFFREDEIGDCLVQESVHLSCAIFTWCHTAHSFCTKINTCKLCLSSFVHYCAQSSLPGRSRGSFPGQETTPLLQLITGSQLHPQGLRQTLVTLSPNSHIYHLAINMSLNSRE